MYRLHKANKYILGEIVNDFASLDDAKSKAQHLFDNPKFTTENKITWIDTQTGVPLGAIIELDEKSI